MEPFPSHKNPLDELRRASSMVPWICLLVRKVLTVPPTSDTPERMFSSTGNIMTRKRTNLTCDHLEELMYLHEVSPKSEGVEDHQEGALGIEFTHRTHAHTHTWTNNTVVCYPFSIIMTTNKSSKKILVHVSDSFCVMYNMCTPS